jgi:hypothetical protein
MSVNEADQRLPWSSSSAAIATIALVSIGR